MGEFSKEVLVFLINNSFIAREIMLLYFIYIQDFSMSTYYLLNCENMKEEDFYKLESFGLINLDKPEKKYYISSYSVTDYFLKVTSLNKRSKKSEVKDWIDEWFDLFPKGIKTGGKYVRTDITACTKRMEKFISEYPHFDKEVVLNATKSYIEDRERNNFSYFMLAPYFIYKDGMSTLSSWCEQIQEEETSTGSDDNPFVTKV